MGVQNQIYAHKIKLVGSTKELSRNPEYSFFGLISFNVL